MTRKATIHSKILQIYITKDDAPALALSGTTEVMVTDPLGQQFGTATLTLSPLARCALLDHLDCIVPRQLRAMAQDEYPLLRKEAE